MDVKITYDRKVLQDPVSRGNIFFVSFYQLLDGLLMIVAAFFIASTIKHLPAKVDSLGGFVMGLCAIFGTMRVLLTLAGLFGSSHWIHTMVENQ